MSNSALVSIIIPSYNYGNYILEALESVVSQSFDNWECIVVDDGSTDDTGKLVAAFFGAHQDRDFKYVSIENSGTSIAKNTGIELARGKYIQFLDADDLLSAEKLRVQVQIIESQDCALVFSRSVFFKVQDSEAVIESKYPPGFLATKSLSNLELLSALVNNNIVTISSPLVHKELLIRAGQFRSTIRNNEDWLLWFKIALLKPIFIFDDDERSYCKIRMHASSAIRNMAKMFSGEVIVREQMAVDLRDHGVGLERELLMKKNQDQLALHRVRSLEWMKGLTYILHSFARHPSRNGWLLNQACYQTLVRMYRLIVPVDGE
jgi:glycosyltransferase involved in cell wall biosynthesis